MEKRKLGDAKYVRLYKDQVDKIEDMRAKRRPIPDISETIRELIDFALKKMVEK